MIKVVMLAVEIRSFSRRIVLASFHLCRNSAEFIDVPIRNIDASASLSSFS
ncbi:MAG TPA: hypothetical protein VHK01_20085 [Lacipirellulaceae bacterium]|jgi:hypothetical protein|nr:hypothetical protein [Lacipirellulaceae bacterium]